MNIAGVDEAGRGSWAGPVVAAAVIFSQEFTQANNHIIASIRDSKKLSAKKRDTLHFALMVAARDGLIGVGVGSADEQEIDHINILQASLLAMRRAVLKCTIKPDAIWVDGLHMPTFSANQLLSLPVTFLENSCTFVKGDDLHSCISAASIIAKVERDRKMVVADKQYPSYGFAQHKGYGTKIHHEALIKHGASAIHRRSFAPVARIIQNLEQKINSY